MPNLAGAASFAGEHYSSRRSRDVDRWLEANGRRSLQSTEGRSENFSLAYRYIYHDTFQRYNILQFRTTNIISNTMPWEHPPDIAGLSLIYRQANEDFANYLYWAAMGLMPDLQLDYYARRRGVERISYDDDSWDDPAMIMDSVTDFRDATVYEWLAHVVVARGPDHISREMLQSLQVEISARLLVDAWSQEHANTIAGVRTTERHRNFTSMLQRVMRVLRIAYEEISGDASVLLAVACDKVVVASVDG